MKYGISTASFYPLKTEDALMNIGKFGAQYCEIFFNTFSELSRGFIHDLKEICEFYNLTPVSVHPFTCAFEPFLLFTEYERRFQDGLELYKRYFDAMNLLGSEIFVFHGDRAASSLENHKYFERFAQLRDVGKEYGVIVAQENVERCKSRDLAFLCEMRDYLEGDLSIVFDNKQAVRSGVDYREFINLLGEYICHVHISDNSPLDDCMPLGKGTLDLNDMLSLLCAADYDGALIVELYSERLGGSEDILTSFEYLRSHDG